MKAHRVGGYRPELLGVHWLGQIAQRAVLDGGHCCFERRAARDENHWNVEVVRPDALEQRYAA
jgi:cell division FtsZ-interacting protein ZapD